MSVSWSFNEEQSAFIGYERIKIDPNSEKKGRGKSGQTVNNDKNAHGGNGQTQSESGSNQAQDETEKLIFTIFAKRAKDIETSVVSLILEGWYDVEECGTIVAYADTLESDLKKFLRYGLVLNNSEIVDLKHIIIENFYSIHKAEEVKQGDTRLETLFAAVRDYAKDNAALLNGNELYIPTTDFDDLALDCGYKTYEIGQLRKFLRDNDYSIAPEGRTSKLARIKNKTTRVVSFDKDKVLSGGEEKKA